MEKVMSHVSKISRDKKIWNYIVLHANNDDAAQWYSEQMVTLTGIPPVSLVNISPVIGANSGIGAAAIALMFD
jgi:fatty acid-binding protein DegV